MYKGRTMHVYSADETIYYGNIMFSHDVFPMSEEEYDEFIKNAIYEHFPHLEGKKLHIIWSYNQ